MLKQILSNNTMILATAGISLFNLSTAFADLTEKIVFTASFNPGDEFDIYMMYPNGTEPVNLTTELDGSIQVAYLAHDGMHLAFSWEHPVDGWGLYIMDTEDWTYFKALSYTDYDVMFNWLDNDTIYYRHTGGYTSVGDIWFLDIDYDNEMGFNDRGPILEAACFGQGSIDDAELSPDGSTWLVDAQAGSWGPSADIYTAENQGEPGGCYNPQVIWEDSSDNYGDPYCMWSNDSQCIYWTHNNIYGSGGNDYSIYSSCKEGFELRPAAGIWVGMFDTSPDDTLLLLSEDGRGLFTYDIATGYEELLFACNAVRSGSWGDIYTPAPPLLLIDPLPGIAGGPNSFQVSQCTFGETVTLKYSLSTGSFELTGCPGVSLDLQNPKMVGSAIANYYGDAWITVNVPSIAKNKTIYFQAYELSTCYISNMIGYLWQ